MSAPHAKIAGSIPSDGQMPRCCPPWRAWRTEGRARAGAAVRLETLPRAPETNSGRDITKPKFLAKFAMNLNMYTKLRPSVHLRDGVVVSSLRSGAGDLFTSRALQSGHGPRKVAWRGTLEKTPIWGAQKSFQKALGSSSGALQRSCRWRQPPVVGESARSGLASLACP